MATIATKQMYLAAEIPLWYQTKAGEPLVFLGCHDLNSVSVPRGDTNPLYCRVGKNKFRVQRTYRGAPGLGQLTLMSYDAALNELAEIPCGFRLFGMFKTGGKDIDMWNFDYLYRFDTVEITSEDLDQFSLGVNPDDNNGIMLSMPATFSQRVKIKTLDKSTIDVSSLISTDDILDVSIADIAECDDTGNFSKFGARVIFLSTGGSTARVLKSTDGGTNWTVTTSPFTDTAQPIHKIEALGDVVLGLNGENASYFYSDDQGVTYTEITTPAKVLNDVFIFNSNNIWFVGNDGYVYQSTNGGVSVSLINAGLTTTSTLLSVSFADSLVGYAVGEDNAFIRTLDGGNIWSAVTGPAGAVFPNDLYVVAAVPGTDSVFVGDESGYVWVSRDKGDTWSQSLYNTNLIGGIRGIEVFDDDTIHIIGNDQDPYFYSGATVDGYFYRSIDGGNSWRGIDIPANDGLRALAGYGPNKFFMVGEDAFVGVLKGQELG